MPGLMVTLNSLAAGFLWWRVERTTSHQGRNVEAHSDDDTSRTWVRQVIGKSNRPEREISRRIEAVRASAETSFRGLLSAGGFDIARDLRFQNLSGLSFAGEDLRGIDFTGANLIDCDFKGARILGARFDRARLANVLTKDWKPPKIDAAADWDEYMLNWVLPETELVDEPDSHLAIGDIFQDSPRLPLVVVIRSREQLSELNTSHRLAITCSFLTRSWWDQMKASSIQDLQQIRANWSTRTSRLEPDRFELQSARQFWWRAGHLARRAYRPPTKDEWWALNQWPVDEWGWDQGVLDDEDAEDLDGIWCEVSKNSAKLWHPSLANTFDGELGRVMAVRHLVGAAIR